ncbi:uncharacterized protein LOC134247525 isoform X2 [Saccostrea cucullata]|uniref:uncharacterized protein LOC134247525 isoform X2 n=1 Tax=Saccostrea cuccullata TaxID=36930 RepID=UPI002ED09772
MIMQRYDLSVLIPLGHVKSPPKQLIHTEGNVKELLSVRGHELNLQSWNHDEDDVTEMSDYELSSDFEGFLTPSSTLDEDWSIKKVEKKICGFPVLNTNTTDYDKSSHEVQKILIHVCLQGSFSRPGGYCMCFFLILTCSMVVVDGTQWQCEVSLTTINFTSICPTNEIDYIKRSKEKNCEDIQQNCTTNSNFKYHCVIDTTGSNFIEVCAPQRFIFGHYCTEFNKGGARVQEHYGYGCKQFNENPCPEAYPSWKCYEYPGCYSLIENEKKAVTSTDQQNITIRNKSCGTLCDERTLSAKISMTFIYLLLMLLVTFVTIGLFWRFRKKGFPVTNCNTHRQTQEDREDRKGTALIAQRTEEKELSTIMIETNHFLQEDESHKEKYNGQTIQLTIN